MTGNQAVILAYVLGLAVIGAYGIHLVRLSAALRRKHRNLPLPSPTLRPAPRPPAPAKAPRITLPATTSQRRMHSIR